MTYPCPLPTCEVSFPTVELANEHWRDHHSMAFTVPREGNEARYGPPTTVRSVDDRIVAVLLGAVLFLFYLAIT